MLFLKIVSIIIILATSLYLIYKLPVFRKTGISLKWRFAFFGIKLIAAFAFLAVYSWYYPKETSDIYKYYEDGKAVYEKSASFKTYASIITGIGIDNTETQDFLDKNTSHWSRKYLKGVWNDNRTMIRFNALFYPLTGGSIIALSLIMLFISYLGLILFYRGFINFTKGSLLYALAIFIIPSVLFWSSGLLKEGLLVFNLGLLFFTASELRKDFKITHLALFVFSVIFFLLIKIYVLICIIPAIVFLLISKNLKKLFIKFLSVHLAVVVIVLLLSHISPKLNMMRVMDRKQYDFVNMVNDKGDAGSEVEIPDIKPNMLSIIKHSPKALYHSLLRPHPLEYRSPLMLLSGIEKIAFLFLIALSVIYFRKPSKNEFAFILFSLSFTLILFIVTGLTTPVLGALVRYNMPALPFFALSLLLITKKDRLTEFLK